MDNDVVVVKLLEFINQMLRYKFIGELNQFYSNNKLIILELLRGIDESFSKTKQIKKTVKELKINFIGLGQKHSSFKKSFTESFFGELMQMEGLV